MEQDLVQNHSQLTSRAVALTASISGNKITISGNGGADLPKNSGAHRFDFTLASPPGVTVEFASLDTQDNCSTCPPASGENSTQIVGVQIGKGGNSASFTDNNNNKGGPMDVSYQWNFTCDDPSIQVEAFDPIIKNGGTT